MKETDALYDIACEITSGIYQSATNGASFDISPLLSVAESLSVSIIRSEGAETDGNLPSSSIYSEVISSAIEPGDWASQAVHVATLSVNLAIGLGYSKEELEKLALAALLHGVGMMRIPRSVLEKAGHISSEDRRLIESHPVLGAELLLGLGNEFDWLEKVVLQEHERHGGQGYPNKLSGKHIHPYARIIGMADTFVSMTHPRPWRSARSPHEAAKEIGFVLRDEFDLQLIKLFLQRVTVFPLNSLVKLNNGSIGKVVATNMDSPLRPWVDVLLGPYGEPSLESKPLDLRKNLILHVVGTVSDEGLE